MNETLRETRRFWNASPCGAQETFQQRFEHRYSVEPWVMDVLQDIAGHHAQVVEIGCGQGTDGIVLCSLLPAGGSYLGVDYSDASIDAAHTAAAEAAPLVRLNIAPRFATGNAEALDFADNSLACIYSNGALHHTANPARAFAEVWRVLEPGGDAYLMLYRKPSIKVGAAKAARAIQAAADALTGRDRTIYQWIRRWPMPSLVGTMLLEGFGVPMLAWYSRADISNVFGRFRILRVTPVGCNMTRRAPASRGWHRWGYMWFLHLQKPEIR
jgi:ubiquinone/menaquinone biosynthesis C-methylase UbiE